MGVMVQLVKPTAVCHVPQKGFKIQPAPELKPTSVGFAGASNAPLPGPPGAARPGPTSEPLPGTPEARALPPGQLVCHSHVALHAWWCSADCWLMCLLDTNRQGLSASKHGIAVCCRLCF